MNRFVLPNTGAEGRKKTRDEKGGVMAEAYGWMSNKHRRHAVAATVDCRADGGGAPEHVDEKVVVAVGVDPGPRAGARHPHEHRLVG